MVRRVARVRTVTGDQDLRRTWPLRARAWHSLRRVSFIRFDVLGGALSDPSEEIGWYEAEIADDARLKHGVLLCGGEALEFFR
jgi:hypothetical protein